MKTVRYLLSLFIVAMLVNVHLEAMEQGDDVRVFSFTCSDSDEIIEVPIKIIKYSSFFNRYLGQNLLNLDPFEVPANRSTFEVVIQCLHIIDAQDNVENNLLDYIGGFIVCNGEEEKFQLRIIVKALEIKPVCDIFEVHGDYMDCLKQTISEQNAQKMDDIIQQARVVFEKVEDKQNSAIVIDVDDTALCCKNALHIIDINGESTDTPYYLARPQVYGLYKNMIGMAFNIFFLTARDESIYDATMLNLVSEGYDVFEELICVPSETRSQIWEQANGCRNMVIESLAQWKASERNKIAEKFKIVGTLDDTEKNLEGENIGHAVLVPIIL